MERKSLSVLTRIRLSPAAVAVPAGTECAEAWRFPAVLPLVLDFPPPVDSRPAAGAVNIPAEDRPPSENPEAELTPSVVADTAAADTEEVGPPSAAGPDGQGLLPILRLLPSVHSISAGLPSIPHRPLQPPSCDTHPEAVSDGLPAL